jgi:DNA (cytosine-5)-methyltransferase 1
MNQDFDFGDYQPEFPDPEINDDKFVFIDLCSGTGGFHMAMDRIKEVPSQVLLAADIDKNCREVYKKNHKLDVHSDLTIIDVEKHHDFNAIFAGFPCQPFSVAGKRMGLDDARGTIIHYVLNMVKTKNPELICLENVKGLKSLKNSDQNGAEVMAYKLIYKVLDDLGYYVTDRIISPIEINIPQNRERVVIIAVRKDLVKNKDITNNEEFGNVVLEDIEKMIEERREENKDYKIFDDNDNIPDSVRLDEEYIEDEELDEDQNNKRKTKIEKKNRTSQVFDMWEYFTTMKEWDNITESELVESYNKATGKKIKRNFKQTHYFTDFLLYKDSDKIPDNVTYPGRKKDTIPKSFYDKCKDLNILYESNKKFKKLVNKFNKKYKNFTKDLPINYRYLEYSGGENYGSESTLNNKFSQIRMSGTRIRKGDTFPTLVKSGPVPIYIKERRYLTLKEMSRLQSLKDDFEFVNQSSAVKQLGNGVNVQVIELMLRGGLKQIYPEKFRVPQEEEETEPVDLKSMKKKELLKYAEGLGLEVEKKMKKKELIKLIEEYTENENNEVEDDTLVI